MVHAPLRSVPWVRERLVRLAVEYVSSYEIDPLAFEAEFGMIDPQDPESLNGMTESPERVLGAMQSPRQAAPLGGAPTADVGDGGLRRPRHRARSAGASSPRSTGSTRRCSATASSGARPSASSRACSGSSSSARTTSGARRSVDGVVERAGLEGLNRLWDEPAMLPDPQRARRARPLAGPHRPPRTRLTPTIDSFAPRRSQCGHHGTVNRSTERSGSGAMKVGVSGCGCDGRGDRGRSRRPRGTRRSAYDVDAAGARTRRSSTSRPGGTASSAASSAAR